jgi:hypothetical protein
VLADRRKLHNEAFTKCNYDDRIQKDELGGASSEHGKDEKSFPHLVGQPEGKRPIARPRRRWEDNIKIHLGKIVFGMYSGFIWFRIGTGDGLLLRR